MISHFDPPLNKRLEAQNGRLDRRRSPNSRQISGHIPIDMYKKLKSVCALKDVSQSEALEQAINIWMKQEKEENLESTHEED